MGTPNSQAQALQKAQICFGPPHVLRLRPQSTLDRSLPPGRFRVGCFGDRRTDLSNLVDVTPLALVAKLFLEFKGLEGAAAKMFGAYDEFLSILNDDDKRRHLDELVNPT